MSALISRHRWSCDYHLAGRVYAGYGFLLGHLTGLVNGGKSVALLLLTPPPRNSGRSSATPPRPSGAATKGQGTARFSSALELTKRPQARVPALVQLHPPNPPPRPSNQRLIPLHALGQAGEQYGPSIAPFVRAGARCPFSPLLRPYSPDGAARGSHTGQFSCFGPRSCFTPFVLDIPNGVWPLNRAVWGGYIREAVAIPSY
jgi:hypothetical protein